MHRYRLPERLERIATTYAFSVLGVLVFGVSAHGQDAGTCPMPVLTLAEAADLLRVEVGELEHLAAAGGVPARKVGASWRFDCAALISWLRGNESAPHEAALTPAELGRTTATGVGSGSRSSTPPQEAPIGEAPEERPAEDVFLRGQRVLLAPGDVVVDFGQFYARSDGQELTQIGTGIGISTVEQELLTTVLVARVGVLEETEVFASTSFSNQNTQQLLGTRRIGSSGNNDFGGLRIGARRTLLREGVGRPDVILTVDGQVLTGEDTPDVGGGVVLVKSVDPVVLFAAGNYHHVFGTGAEGAIAVGDRVDVSIGYGLALNDTLALSMSVSGLFAEDTIVNGSPIRQPDSFSAGFGLTSWLAEGLYIEPSVSFGLNGPGDSVAFGVTLPYAF